MMDTNLNRFEVDKNIQNLPIKEFLAVANQCKILICGVMLFSVVSAIFYSKTLPNKFTSEAIIVPAQSNSDNKLSGLMGQFGGIAGLAGIDLGGGAGDKTQLLLETLGSYQFITHFVSKYELKVPLFAGTDFNFGNNSWNLDPDVYDYKNSLWVREAPEPFIAEPSDWEVYKRFKNEVLSMNNDKKAGVIRISIKLRSAHAAKKWVDLLVDELNSWLREKSINEKQKTIDYLLAQVSNTNVAEMQKIFYSLIEKEQMELMLAQTKYEYALSFIDHGVLSPIKSEPNRVIIVMFGFISGLFLSVFLVLIKFRR